MMAQMALIANRSRTVGGVPTSLSDIGYDDVGLDDNWQACGSYGPNGYSFHDTNGRPVVNQQRFPDFMAMTNYAHSLGLTAGWYCFPSDTSSFRSILRRLACGAAAFALAAPNEPALSSPPFSQVRQ